MFRNLIFDWSGTLVDDMGPVIDATNHVFGIYGLPGLDREQFRLRFRLPYREFYAEVLPGVPLEELEVHFRSGFSSSQVPVTILPHAREKLEWCRRQGIRMFILSSMDPAAFSSQLSGLGLEEFFEATYAGVIDKRDKIGEIISQHQLVRHETAFVGDMVHDVETARHGQLVSIAVLTGYTHASTLAEARPDLTVPDLAALRVLMERQPHGPVVAVGALVINLQGEILMIRSHKWSGLWGMPGGKVRRGEKAADALRREILEETGLETEDPVFVMTQDCIQPPEFGRSEHFLILAWTVRSRSREVILNDEGEEFRWVTPAEAFALDLNQPTRTLLVEAVNQGLFTRQLSS